MNRIHTCIIKPQRKLITLRSLSFLADGDDRKDVFANPI